MESDSGKPIDLDGVEVQEVIKPGKATGAMVDYAQKDFTGDWYAGSLPGTDRLDIIEVMPKINPGTGLPFPEQQVRDLSIDSIESAIDRGGDGQQPLSQYITFIDNRT